MNKMKISQGLKWDVSSQPFFMAVVVSFTGKETRTSAAQISQCFREATTGTILENLFQKYFIIEVLSFFPPSCFLPTPFSSYSLFLIGFINYIKSNGTR